MNDGREVAEVIETLDVARAREIGNSAQRRILAEHTYLDRGKQVDALLQMLKTVQDNVVEVHS